MNKQEKAELKELRAARVALVQALEEHSMTASLNVKHKRALDNWDKKNLLRLHALRMKEEGYVASADNVRRAGYAENALLAFGHDTGQDLAYDQRDMVVDLLCNLHHYCTQHGLDFADIARSAEQTHYEVEKGGEE